jgi:hypothetical protein
VLAGYDGSRKLEGKITREEETGKQRALLRGDMEGGGQSSRCTEAIVGAIQICEAIGDGDRWEQEQPAAPQARLDDSRGAS